MKIWLLCVWSMVFSNGALALELEMPSVFADHMVLQCDQMVPVWGTADTGATVVVRFGGQEHRTIANAIGAWRVDLDALKASAESRVLKVAASLEGKTVDRTMADVLVGEVWLCGGQSNMYRPFRMLVSPAVEPEYEPIAEYLRAEARSANDPLFRQYRAGRAHSPSEGLKQGRGNWSKAVVGPVNEFCGTAYFFGRELRRELNVPVAIISCNLGGTMIEPWIAPQAFRGDDSLVDEYESSLEAHRQRIDQWDQGQERAKYRQALKKWQERGEKGRQPRKPEPPARDKQVYGTLYNGMVHPLIPYAIKGAIWYQGESNSNHLPERYGKLLTHLVNSWRKAWGQERYHFFWCQLANYKPVNDQPVGDDDTWALVRNGQSSTLSLPDTGMAVLSDIGEARDVHPKNKVDVGNRLSLWALKQAYDRDLVCSGPLFHAAKLAGNKVIVTFDHSGGGLMVGRKDLMNPTIEVDEPLRRFQICGADRVWEWAEAKIVGEDSVAVWHTSITHPAEVRYAWSSNPAGANLYNRAGLPASLFKTEDFQAMDKNLKQQAGSD